MQKDTTKWKKEENSLFLFTSIKTPSHESDLTIHTI